MRNVGRLGLFDLVSGPMAVVDHLYSDKYWHDALRHHSAEKCESRMGNSASAYSDEGVVVDKFDTLD